MLTMASSYPPLIHNCKILYVIYKMSDTISKFSKCYYSWPVFKKGPLEARSMLKKALGWVQQLFVFTKVLKQEILFEPRTCSWVMSTNCLGNSWITKHNQSVYLFFKCIKFMYIFQMYTNSFFYKKTFQIKLAVAQARKVLECLAQAHFLLGSTITWAIFLSNLESTSIRRSESYINCATLVHWAECTETPLPRLM